VSAQPQISVVVPSRNRAHLLARLLGCLADQRGADAFEVIVVDDCSEDGTEQVLAQLSGTTPFPLVVARTERPAGSAAARNVGWRLATASLVAFTDDDCRPQPGWLAGLIEGFADAEVVQGSTAHCASEADGRGPFSQVVNVERWSGQFETSNVAYRRDLLERLGGFDERFEGDSYGEDVDLGWRALEAGAYSAFAQDAVVVHDVKRGPALQELLASLRDARRWRHIGRVLRDHPAYRPYRLHRDPFLAATHPPTLLALAGLAVIVAGPRRGRALAACCLLPWLRHRTVVEPRAGSRCLLPMVLPAAFAVDAVETVTVAYSGVRYRTLVL
jgi:glycosyltransferase involved in cell wall biosynthesis